MKFLSWLVFVHTKSHDPYSKQLNTNAEFDLVNVMVIIAITLTMVVSELNGYSVIQAQYYNSNINGTSI